MDNTSPRVAVVILAWNGKNYLEKFLPSVVSSAGPNLEIWIADNDSRDGTADYLRQHWPQLQLLRLERNSGFAAGYNQALARINADYYVLLNQDVEVVPGWIDPILALMQRDRTIAAAQPKLRAYHQKDEFEYAGGAGGFLDRWGYPFCRGRLFDAVEKDHGQYDQTREVFWATGAAFVVRAELFHRLGGFDEEFFAHMEEIDLCWRLKNAGFKIFCVCESVAYHVGGGSLPRENPRKTFLNFRNNLITLIKNLPAAELWWKLPARLAWDQLAAVQAVARGNAAVGAAIWRAQGHVIWRWPEWKRHRAAAREAVNQNRIGPGNPAGIFHGSLVRLFFLGRLRRFSDLPPKKFAG